MKKLDKALKAHLQTLILLQDTLFEKGHDFWHCDSQDEEHKKPFYYYQINRVVNMSTCGTCQKLIENRKRIRSIQKQLGVTLLPLWTNEKSEEHVIRMSVSDSRVCNPNYRYIS